MMKTNGKCKTTSNRLLTLMLAVVVVATTVFGSGVTAFANSSETEPDLSADVILATAENGSLSFADKEGTEAQFQVGDTVNVNVTPDDGYIVNTLSATNLAESDEVEYIETEAGISFTMPESPVHISASYRLNQITVGIDVASEVEPIKKVETSEDYILKNADSKYVGKAKEVKPYDIVYVKHTMVDGHVLKNPTIDDLFGVDEDDDDIADNWEAFEGQYTIPEYLYELSEDSDYVVGKIDNMSADESTVTDWAAANNNDFGEVRDDIIFDAKTGLVYVPKTARIVDDENKEIIVGGVRVQLVHTLTGTDINGAASAMTEIQVNVDSKRVKGDVPKAGIISADVLADSTLIQIAGDIVAENSIKDSTVQSVVVDGVKFTSSDYRYDSETGVLELNVPPITVNSVDVKLENPSLLGKLFAPLTAYADVWGSENWVWANDGVIKFNERPSVGMVMYPSATVQYSGTGSPYEQDSYYKRGYVTNQSYNINNGMVIEVQNAFSGYNINISNVNRGNSNYSMATFRVRINAGTINIEGSPQTVEMPTGYYLLECAHIKVNADAKSIGSGAGLGSASYIYQVRLKVHEVTDSYIIFSLVCPSVTTQAGIAMFKVRWETNGGDLKIVKSSDNPSLLDLSCYSLQGARFNVYNSANELVGTVTTDANGTGTLQGLPAGNYRVVEIESSPGHLIAPEQNITITNGNTTTAEVVQKPGNDPGQVGIYKMDADGNPVPQGDSDFSGAEFTLKYWDNTDGNTSGAPTRTWVYTTNNPDRPGWIGFHLESQIVPEKSDAIFRNSDGALILPFGTYNVTETKAPVGYHINTDLNYTYVVEWDSVLGIIRGGQEKEVPEQGFTGTVNIEKWDIDLDKNDVQGDATFAGIELTIYNRSKAPVTLKGQSTVAVGGVVGKVTLDAQGKASMKGLPVGTYEIVETDAKTSTTGYHNSGIISRVFSIAAEAGDDQVVYLQDASTAIKNNVVRGGFELEKWSSIFDAKRPSGDGTLAGATVEIINKSANPVVVDDVIYEVNAVIAPTFTTDANGNIASPTSWLPKGTYLLRETGAPTGYLPQGVLERQFSITKEGEVWDGKTKDTAIKNDEVKGGVKINKMDNVSKTTTPQGDASMSNAVFEITNISENPVVVKGTEYPVNAVVMEITTNANGLATTGTHDLPYGTYRIDEVTPPTGYLNTGIISRQFEVRNHGEIVDKTAPDDSIQNDVVRGGVAIAKWDLENNSDLPLGGATFENTEIQIINRSAEAVYVEGVWYDPGQVVKTVFTDADGKYVTATDLLPYGSYDLVEITAPEGYLHEGELLKSFTVRDEGVIVNMDTHTGAIKNQVKRGDLELIKIADSTHKRLAFVDFEIKSLTTGEAHIFVTDENGQAKTQSDWNPHTQNTNRGETDLDGVWFGLDKEGNNVAVNNSLGALPYDTYTVTELPCDANEGYILVPPITITIKRDNTVVNMGTVTDDADVIEIKTTFVDAETREHEAYISGNSSLVDIVDIEGATEGRTYELHAQLMDKETKEILVVDGEEVTAKVRFVADARNMSVEVPFILDTLSLQGKYVVAYEKLYLVKNVDTPSEELMERAAHEDINDEGQTMFFKPVEIGTTFVDTETREHEAYVSGNSSLTDVVDIKGTIAGETYELQAKLMDKETEDVVVIDDEEVTATVRFVADATNMSVDVPFNFNTISLQGKYVVAYEKLYFVKNADTENEKVVEIASHEDIDDEGQTMLLKPVEIGTTFVDAKTREHEAYISGNSSLIDIVDIEGAIPGETYELQAQLMDKETGDALLVDNEEVTAKVRFVADAVTMSVDVPFEFDTTALHGKYVVAYEKLYFIKDADTEDEELLEIASHEDIDDEGQTMLFKPVEIGTTFVDAETREHTAIVSGNSSLVDVVDIEGAIVDETYELQATLMDKETGEILTIGDENVTATVRFIADAVKMSVDVPFNINTLLLKDKYVVAYEKLFFVKDADTEDEKLFEVALHEDINDEGQTMLFKPVEISTKAFDIYTNINDGYGLEKSGIGDIVTMKGLIVGQKYTAVAVVMAPDTEDTLQIPTEETDTDKSDDKSDKIKSDEDSADKADSDNKSDIATDEDTNDDSSDTTTDEDDSNTDATEDEDDSNTDATEDESDKNTTAKTISSDVNNADTDETVVENEAYKKVLESLGEPEKGMKYVTGFTEFVAKAIDQEVTVDLPLDSRTLTNKSVVVFEYLFDEFDSETPVGEHTEMTDSDQTITYKEPSIGTKAINKDNGKSYAIRGEAFTLSDTIKYKDMIPGTELTFVGLVMDKATGEPAKNADGNVITASVTHTPTAPTGEVVVDFAVDTKNMTETTLVVYEWSYVGNPDDESNTPIASHEDINDKDQSIDLVTPEVAKEIIKTGQMKTAGLIGLILLAGISGFGLVWYRRKRSIMN